MNKNANKNILKLARPEIVTIKPYSSARSEAQNEKEHVDEIYLNANENNYTIVGYENLNRYPVNIQPESLLQKMAALYNVTTDKIIVTRGSDESIDLLIRAFCRAYQDKIIICPPTYGMYAVSANIQSAGIIEVPLIADKGFSLDVDGILAAWNPQVKLIFLCSPNNPTGNLMAQDAVFELCQKLSDKALVIVDEAYVEFSESPSLVSYVEKYPNLVVLRTLSKCYGLAGVRCGAAIADASIIKLLLKIIAPYPLPTPIVDIVCQYLTPKNLSTVKANLALILQQREIMYKFLLNLPSVEKVWQSQGNFLLFKVDDAKRVMYLCAKNGIIIRDRSHDYGLKNCVRISIGTEQENQILMEVLTSETK